MPGIFSLFPLGSFFILSTFCTLTPFPHGIMRFLGDVLLPPALANAKLLKQSGQISRTGAQSAVLTPCFSIASRKRWVTMISR